MVDLDEVSEIHSSDIVDMDSAPTSVFGTLSQPATLDDIEFTPDNLNAIWGKVKTKLLENNHSLFGRKTALRELLNFPGGDFSSGDIDIDNLVDELRRRRPILREMGRQRPSWDNVWKNVHPARGYHRRHIVMSSVMRMATYNVVDNAINSGQQKKLARMFESLLGYQKGQIDHKTSKP